MYNVPKLTDRLDSMLNVQAVLLFPYITEILVPFELNVNVQAVIIFTIIEYLNIRII